MVLQLLLARCLEAAAEVETGSDRSRLARLRLAEPGEFTQRAFLNDKLDLAQAEAVADLIEASTEAAARSAGRSLSGEFSQQIDALRQRIVRLRTLVEATLDFPEEEIDFLQQADAHGQLAAITATLAGVMARARQGALLREGLQVVLAGQPNVGKSSLLNALAGAELAIVTAIPGTTRDKVSQTIQIEGVPLHVIDTAGLRAEGETADEVERIGIARSWEAIAQADAVIFLHDLTRRGQPDYEAAVSGKPERSRNPMNCSAVFGGCFQAASIACTRARTVAGFRSIRWRRKTSGCCAPISKAANSDAGKSFSLKVTMTCALARMAAASTWRSSGSDSVSAGISR